MQKIVIWGADVKGINLYYKLIKCRAINVVAFADNNPVLWKSVIDNVLCIAPAKLHEIEFDYIIISCNIKEDINKQIVNELNIAADKILDMSFKILNCGETFHLGNIELKQELPLGFINIDDMRTCVDVSSLNDLQKIYLFGNHKPIYKEMHYLEAYDRFFRKFRSKKVKILEIGIWQGGSLQMWKEYFGKDAVIVGIDINPECKLLEEDRVEISIGNQGDRNFLKYIKNKYGNFDVIVDDGGHMMEQQIITFDEMFDCLTDEGVYCCEDLCTSYWNEYQGGYGRKSTFIEFSKGLIDDLNAFQNRSGQPAINRYTQQIKSISYFNTIAFIEKQKPVTSCITFLS